MKHIAQFLFVFYYFFQLNSLVSQQLPIFTQYREYHAFINPATINSDFLTHEYDLSIGSSYRQQWSQLPSPPTNILLRGEYLIKTDGKFHLLVGGNLLKDDTSPISFTTSQLKIAGVLADDPFLGALSVGLVGGAAQYRVNTADIIFVQQESNIPLLNQKTNYFDLGAGIYWHKQLQTKGYFKGDNLFAGFSIPQILEPQLRFRDKDGAFGVQLKRHYYALIGFYDSISDSGFIEWSIWLKNAQNIPLHADFNVRTKFNDWFWLGAGVSTNCTYHGEVGFMVRTADNQHVKIGYGYDYGFAHIRDFFGDSHEINVSFLMQTKKVVK